MTKYSLSSGGYCTSRYGEGFGNHLLQWAIQGSNNGSSWEELDRRNTEDVNGNYITKKYDCQSRRDKSFCYLRLLQAGKNRDGKDDLVLSGIEFLRTLRTDGKVAVVQMRLLREE